MFSSSQNFDRCVATCCSLRLCNNEQRHIDNLSLADESPPFCLPIDCTTVLHKSPVPQFIDCPLADVCENSSSGDDVIAPPTVVGGFKKPVRRYFTACAGSADDDSSVDSFAGDIDLDLIENN